MKYDVALGTMGNFIFHPVAEFKNTKLVDKYIYYQKPPAFSSY